MCKKMSKFDEISRFYVTPFYSNYGVRKNAKKTECISPNGRSDELFSGGLASRETVESPE